MKESPFKLVPIVLALAAAVFVAALGALSFQHKIQTFQSLGFDARAANGTWMVLSVEQPSPLERGDFISLVDGKEVATREQLRQALHAGPESTLLVARGDELLEISYARPALRLDFPYLLQALLGTLFLLVGLITLTKTRRREGLLFYGWCLLYSSLFLMTPSAAGPPDVVERLILGLEDLSRVLLPALTVHLFLVFPSPLGLRRGRRLIPFFYLPSLLLLTLHADLTLGRGRFLFDVTSEAGMATAFAALERFSLVYLVGYSLLAAALLGYRILRNPQWQERRQLQWIALGTAVGYLPLLSFLLAGELFQGPWGTSLLASQWLQCLVLLPLALVPLTFAWAILRFKLWDIEVLLRDTVSYTVTVLVGVLGFALVNMAVSRGVPQGLGLVRNVLTFGSGLMIAALVAPARRRISTALERLQYRGTFGQRQRLRQVGDELLQQRDLRQLAGDVLESLEEGLELEKIGLYLVHGDRLVAVRQDPELPAELGVEDLGEELWTSDVQPLSPITVPAGDPTAEQRLFMAGCRYAFPMTVREGRVGVALLGYKYDNRPLNSDDLELARALLSQTALAIENAGLVSQLRERLEEVHRLRDYNEGIITSSPAGIAVLTDVPAGRAEIVSANPAFARLVRRPQTELPGLALEEVLPVRPLPEQTGSPLEVSYCDVGGGEHHLQLSLARLESEDDQPLCILMVHDVSDRVAMENALREQDRLAALGMLAAGVAHEVNTPLTGISSYAQMLLDETPEGDPRRALLHKVEQQTFRASRIVNNLLEFARNRSHELRPTAVDRVLQETLDLLKERLHKKCIRVVWIHRDEDVIVNGSDGELQQVFTNLILNAVDAMTGQGDATLGGELRLGVFQEAQRVRVQIEDTGPGIPRERLEKIFQPFFSTKLTRGGTGLGLSISYDIVRRHGGEMRVASRVGEGTRFDVELPRCGPQA